MELTNNEQTNNNMKYFYLLFFGILLFSNYACNTAKIGENLGGGLRQGVEDFRLDTAHIADVSEAVVRAAVEEALRAEIGNRVQAQLDPILGQFMDSLNITTNMIRENLTGEASQIWLQTQVDMLGQKLQLTAAGLREELIGEATKQNVQTLVREALTDELNSFLANYMSQVNSPQNRENLTLFRARLSTETDALITSAIGAASVEFERTFDPKIKAYIDSIKTVTGDTEIKVGSVVDSTTRSARNLLGVLFGGLGGLLLLGGLVRYYVSTRKYKDMIKILTNNIDKIGSQTEYDKLVGNIRKTMDVKGLNEELAEILKEQNLDEQPEWDDKDKQVLRLISKHLKEKRAIEDVATLEAEARDLGLDGHLESVINRTV